MDFVSRAAESDRNLGPVPAFLHVSYTFTTVTLVGQRWMVPAALSAALLAFRLNLKFFAWEQYLSVDSPTFKNGEGTYSGNQDAPIAVQL
jgi:hypothetical protein